MRPPQQRIRQKGDWDGTGRRNSAYTLALKARAACSTQTQFSGTGACSAMAHEVDVKDEAIKVQQDFPGAPRLSGSVRSRHDEKERNLRVGVAGGRLAGFGQVGPSANETRRFHITAPAGFPSNIGDLSFARYRRTAESCKCLACRPQSARWCQARPCRI